MSARDAAHIAIPMHDFGAGGTERIAIRLANAWVAQGRTVTLIYGSGAGPLFQLVDAQVRRVQTDPAIVRSPGSRRRLGIRLASIVEEIRPDLIFVPGNFHVPVIAALLKQLKGKRPRVVLKLSNPIRRDDRNGLSQFIFERQLRHRLRALDALVAMSGRLAEEAALTMQHRRIVSIAEPTLPDGALPRLQSVSPGLELMAAGRFVEQKNFRLALEALALIDDPRVTLTLYGDGPARAELQKLAASLGIAHRVSMPGYADDFQQHLLRARMLLIPSIYEGYPAVAVEALAAGVPVIATDCSPAIREILRHAELGCIVPPRNPCAMAEAIRQRLAAPAADAAALAAAVEHHRIGPIANQYLRLFDELMREAGRSPDTPDRTSVLEAIAAEAAAAGLQPGHAA